MGDISGIRGIRGIRDNRGNRGNMRKTTGDFHRAIKAIKLNAPRRLVELLVEPLTTAHTYV